MSLALRLIGAGMGRTGTTSLQEAPSVRDTDTWWASLEHLYQELDIEIAAGGSSGERQVFLNFLETLYRDEAQTESEAIKASYEAYNQRVLDHAEADEGFKNRLVVWRAGDGWEPICKTLELPVPDLPFPHKNKRGEYHGF